VIAPWESMLDLVRRMLAAAEAGEFGRVLELENERSGILSQLPQPTEEQLQLLRDIVETDRRVVALTVAAHRQAAAALEHQRRASSHAASYARMSRIGL